MKINYNVLILLILASHLNVAQKLLSPQEFLGYELGSRFSPHHKVVDYFKHVDEQVSNMQMIEYGKSYEHRPLVYAVITSQKNFENLKYIQAENIHRTKATGHATFFEIPIIWLSYNVHGDEASSLEASMMTLYHLAQASDEKTKEWLENTVVIIDPCINPDGRDRYANFYNQYGNRIPNASSDANEHYEPWPGGRFNHYLFDLNRDWAWLTQAESQQRLKVYNMWMPHLHVDFHEQGYNQPYYFAPAAEPMHKVITPWQKELQTLIGKNNAKYFDEQGWLYFTKEVFDLYYPSYGDTYPSYNGAVGMTYEQGGSGFAGLAIQKKEGDILSLRDRIIHHHTTALSTLEAASQHRTRIIEEFEKYFRDNVKNPIGVYKSIVIKADNNEDKLEKLTQWLDAHEVKYGHATSNKTFRGFDYNTRSETNFNISPTDLVFNIYQPKSRFITAVFEPESTLTDSLTYDVTAWNLIYAYGLKSYASKERIDVSREFEIRNYSKQNITSSPYAYIFRYQSLSDVNFLAELLNTGLTIKYTQSAFVLGNEKYDEGTLLVTRGDNVISNFDSTVQVLAGKHRRKMYTTTTGYADAGRDLGSAAVKYLKAPRIAMLFGDQTSATSAGEIWHFFEQQIKYPVTQISTSNFKQINLNSYDVLIIPEGYYKLFDEPAYNKILEWVSASGKLILVGTALNNFKDKQGFGIKSYSNNFEQQEADGSERAFREGEALTKYAEVERKNISNKVYGAIYRVRLDTTHPLAYGLNRNYYTIKTSTNRYAYLENGYNVGVIEGKAKPIQGFAGYRANVKLNNSLVYGVEERGSGKIIYLVDNPLFRSFWESGKMIFSNAVFMLAE